MMTARTFLMFPLAALPLAVLLSCSPTRVVQPVLSIVNISPSGGATGVALDVVVSVTFTDTLIPETVTGDSVLLLDESEQPVPADITYVPASQAVLLVPTDPLALAADYVLILSTDLQSSGGAALVTEIRSTFRSTGDAPSNQLPIADAGSNKTVAVGATVLLDGTGSIDPEGAALDYAWSLQTVPPGSIASMSAADAANASFQADLPGDFLVSLVVFDGLDNSSPAYVQITASDNPIDTGDTGGTDDTGSTDSYEGRFSGAILMDVTEDEVIWAYDVCAGTISLEVSLTSNPPISGTWSCDFSPTGDFYFVPTVTGTIDGTFTSGEGDVAGTFSMEDDDTQWTGKYGAPGRPSFNNMSASISASEVIWVTGGSSLTIGYSGNFTATRQ
jgi:hypothetical protein